ncbi:hypothetical protein Q5P01_006002 [Channa striata]|uniref:ADP-ribosylation factor-like protein 11 n=1 Tax=Channa striata TaxID=64152 RepID=A0AA88NF00_CHASR|nr:hypothetical protein Q5P01_006002 [Channa striata]
MGNRPLLSGHRSSSAPLDLETTAGGFNWSGLCGKNYSAGQTTKRTGECPVCTGTEEHENLLEVLPGDCKALVFVVDSSDQGQLPEAQKALKKVVSEGKLRDVPLMVLANKSDLQNARSIREISTHLNLPGYSDRSWEIQACSALKGLGLQQAFLSVHSLIRKH